MTQEIDDIVDHTHAVVNDVRLHYVEAGPEDGDLVVFLHGFPEYWRTWTHQLAALADAGYRVVAPDLRGYNRSEKPHGLTAYRLEELVTDVEALVGELGGESAHLVSHDWGGMIGWTTAMRRPETVDRLVVLNAPHPIKYVREMTVEQALRSWYVLFFQLPWLPERLLAARDYRAIEDLFREGPTREDAFSDEDVSRLKRAAERPGALESAINYYRALARGQIRSQMAASIPVLGGWLVDPVEPIDRPTLVCWGEQDDALALEQLEGLDRYVDDLRIERFPAASHWVHADRPERVTESILEFLPNAGGS